MLRPALALPRLLTCLLVLLASPALAVRVSQNGTILALSSNRTRLEFDLRTGHLDGYLLRGERFLKEARLGVSTSDGAYNTTDAYHRTLRAQSVKDAWGSGREVVIDHSGLLDAPDLSLTLRMYDQRNLVLLRLSATSRRLGPVVLKQARLLDGVLNLSSQPEGLRVLTQGAPVVGWAEVQLPDLWPDHPEWQTESRRVLAAGSPLSREGMVVGAGTATPEARVRFGFDPERDNRNPWVSVEAGAEDAPLASLNTNQTWTSDWVMLTSPGALLSGLDTYGAWLRAQTPAPAAQPTAAEPARPGWDGVVRAAQQLSRRYFLPGAAAPLAQEPGGLTEAQRSTWSTLVALSRPAARRAGAPPAARPVGLLDPAPGLAPRSPSVWQIPGASLAPGRRVVALFNWDATGAQSVTLDPQSLGLQRQSLVYDTRTRRLAGELRGLRQQSVPAASSQVLVLLPRPSRPSLLASEPSDLAGDADLRAVRWSAVGSAMSGQALKTSAGSQTLIFYLPAGWKVLGAKAAGGRARVSREGSLLRLELSSATAPLTWTVRFRGPKKAASGHSRLGLYLPPVSPATRLSSPSSAPLRLADLEPLWHEGGLDSGDPPVARRESDLQVLAPGTLAYVLPNNEGLLSGEVRAEGSAEMLFRVLRDGQEAWSSGPLKSGQSAKVEVPLKGVRELRLESHRVSGPLIDAWGRWVGLTVTPSTPEPGGASGS